MLEHSAVAFAAHAAFDVSKTVVEAVFRQVARKRPDLEFAAQQQQQSKTQ